MILEPKKILLYLFVSTLIILSLTLNGTSSLAIPTKDQNTIKESNEAISNAYIQRGIIYLKTALAETRVNCGLLHKATEDFNQAIVANCNSAWAYVLRGDTYRELGYTQKAIDDYSKAITIDPKYVWAYARRCNIYREFGQYGKAADDYSKILITDPKNIETYFQIIISPMSKEMLTEVDVLTPSGISSRPAKLLSSVKSKCEDAVAKYQHEHWGDLYPYDGSTMISDPKVLTTRIELLAAFIEQEMAEVSFFSIIEKMTADKTRTSINELGAIRQEITEHKNFVNTSRIEFITDRIKKIVIDIKTMSPKIKSDMRIRAGLITAVEELAKVMHYFSTENKILTANQSRKMSKARTELLSVITKCRLVNL